MSSISTCKKIGELPSTENLLPKTSIALFRAHNEFLVTDIEAIRTVLSKLNTGNQEIEEYLKMHGLYLVIRREVTAETQ